jgi:uncharacterized MnhB-related membrane protein
MALATVMSAQLLRSVIGLAATSALVSIVLFRMHAPIAAVFELSVGAGLIPAIFLSVIGMTKRLTAESLATRRQEKLKLYWALPMVVVLAGVLLLRFYPDAAAAVATPPTVGDVRTVFWHQRHVDLIGQILILLGGAFSVSILAKELEK